MFVSESQAFYLMLFRFNIWLLCCRIIGIIAVTLNLSLILILMLVVVVDYFCYMVHSHLVSVHTSHKKMKAEIILLEEKQNIPKKLNSLSLSFVQFEAI